MQPWFFAGSKFRFGIEAAECALVSSFFCKAVWDVRTTSREDFYVTEIPSVYADNAPRREGFAGVRCPWLSMAVDVSEGGPTVAWIFMLLLIIVGLVLVGASDSVFLILSRVRRLIRSRIVPSLQMVDSGGALILRFETQCFYTVRLEGRKVMPIWKSQCPYLMVLVFCVMVPKSRMY